MNASALMETIPASECARWRAAMAPFPMLDATYLPEYHLAYSLRIAHSSPLLWHYRDGSDHFIYPFLLTPVMISDQATGYHDISGIYGYTGPIATTRDTAFLEAAWRAFDHYSASHSIIAEFIRFSPFNGNEGFAHPATQVEMNRTLAASNLPHDDDSLLQQLGSKTRNMLRKAGRAGLTARPLPLPEYLPAFRALYDETMRRNAAPEFFQYDDAYYGHLLALEDGLRLFGTFHGTTLVAASMAVCHGASGLYHLGASLSDYAKLGAGNLSLFEMSRSLMASGVRFINMTGGRTQAVDDPLLLFKKSNATGTAPFYIGKRVVDAAGYDTIRKAWHAHSGQAPDVQKIIFWRP